MSDVDVLALSVRSTRATGSFNHGLRSRIANQCALAISELAEDQALRDRGGRARRALAAIPVCQDRRIVSLRSYYRGKIQNLDKRPAANAKV